MKRENKDKKGRGRGLQYLLCNSMAEISFRHWNGYVDNTFSLIWPSLVYSPNNNTLKVIRHVFGFGIEFLENKDIGIFGHFMVIDFITLYSSHTYFSPFSTSWYRRFGAGCIVRNSEWHIFVNYSVFSALFSLKRRILFEKGILGTLVQKDAVPPMVISNYHRRKPDSTKTDLCIELSLFTSH